MLIRKLLEQRLTQFWRMTRTQRLVLLIRGWWSFCANAIRLGSGTHCPTWITADALTKIFHSRAAGARVLPLGCVVIIRPRARPLETRDRSSPNKFNVNLTTQLLYAHLAWLMQCSGTRLMRFGKANAQLS